MASQTFKERILGNTVDNLHKASEDTIDVFTSTVNKLKALNEQAAEHAKVRQDELLKIQEELKKVEELTIKHNKVIDKINKILE